MDAYEYEKPFDNRRAARVSRDGRAPRAAAGRKSCASKELESMDARQNARGAQVSRAARGHIVQFSGRACPPLYALSIEAPQMRTPRWTGVRSENAAIARVVLCLPFAASRERRPPECDGSNVTRMSLHVTRMSLNVTGKAAPSEVAR
jgi:hypothetical protein